MAKVITFSRVFPDYHPSAGGPTYFIEQICNSFTLIGHPINDIDELCTDHIGLDEDIKSLKNHTIRSGHRFKVGDWFSPRVWSGRPYYSKQIILAPDIQVAKIWNVKIDQCGVWSTGLLGEQDYYIDDDIFTKIAENEGLMENDLLWFFNQIPFDGQMICWNPNIEY